MGIILKIQIEVKHFIFPNPAILLVNKIDAVEKAFARKNIINFTNDNSAERPTFISRDFKGSFLKKFQSQFQYDILTYQKTNFCL